jgi:hypothetical protein
MFIVFKYKYGPNGGNVTEEAGDFFIYEKKTAEEDEPGTAGGITRD